MNFFDKIIELLNSPAGQAPTQQQVDNLYRQLDKFVEQAQQEAFEQHKPLLIVIGEQHKFSHNSVLVESMLLDIAKRRGINNLFYEGCAEHIKHCLNNPPGEYLFGQNDIDNPSFGSISYETLNHAQKNSLKIIPTETTDVWLLDEVPASALREKEMVQTIACDDNGSALSIFGADHLKTICEDPTLNSRFLVRPINTVPIEFSEVDGASTPEAVDFTFHSKKVTQFRVAGNFFHTKPSYLLQMAAQAHASFTANREQESNTPAKVRSSAGKISDAADNTNTTTQKAAAVTSAATAPHCLPSTLVATPLPLAETDSVSVTIPEPRYPTESIPPISVFSQVGFWAASKLGFCANPAYSKTAVQPANEAVRMMQKETVQEASANQKLQAQGSSLEASLHYLFGKSYANSETSQKNRLKKFVIDVTNGEVDSSIGLRFNDFANISNRHERVKQLTKLLKEAEERTTMQRFGFSPPTMAMNIYE